MVRRLKHPGAALAVVILMAGSTQAATVFDSIKWPDELPRTVFGFALTDDTVSRDDASGPVIGANVKRSATPEPATMILLGTGLLAAFRARRHQQV